MWIALVVLGVLLLGDALWRKRPFRLGIYEFDDESDIVLDRRTGKRFEIFLGIALIAGGILIHASD